MQLKAHEGEQYIGNAAGYHRIILIYGPDQGFVEERVQRVLKQALDGNDDPFSKISLMSDNIAADPGRLADEANAIGLFGGKKVIRVHLNGSRPITKAVALALDEGTDHALIVLEGGDLKPSHGVRSLVEKSKNGMAIPCYMDDSQTLSRLLTEELTLAHLTIEREAQNLLLSMLGDNRKTSRLEIQKLCLYAHHRDKITLADVENLMGDVSTSLIDDTIDQILTGELKSGLDNFEKSLALGTDSFRTISALQRHLMRLQLFDAQRREGQSVQSIIKNARPKLYFKRTNLVTQQITLWDQFLLKRALSHIHSMIALSRETPQLSTTLARATLTSLGQRAKQRRRFA